MLISHGARDAPVEVATAQRMLILNRSARLSIDPDAGHAPFLEDAARFNRELATLVESGPSVTDVIDLQQARPGDPA